MKILCIDTSLKQCHIALCVNDKAWYKSELNVVRGQDGLLPEIVENLLNKAGIQLSDIDYLAIVVGPGSFTGIRIGLAYAKGILIGTKAQGVALTSFDLLKNKNIETDPYYAVPIKANCFAVQAPDGEMRQMVTEELDSLSEIVIPDIADAERYDFKKTKITSEILLSVAKMKISKGDLISNVSDIMPIYLRDADVTVKKK